MSRLAGYLTVLALACLFASGAATARAAQLEPVGSFASPIYLSSDPSNPNRLLVVEREGRIVQVEAGARRTLADLRDAVNPAGEGGLLSVAPAPDFRTSGRLYVFYTGTEEVPAEIHVAELRTGPGVATPDDLRDLVTIPHPEVSNHYGGQVQIGPDGYLYASTGDGGSANDENENSQDLGSSLGKLLRIDPSAEPGTAEVWSWGLRNPFRFSFDRDSGDLWIGDVGQGKWEEVDFSPAPAAGQGVNFGWACREGFEAGPRAATPECEALDPAQLTDPVFVYANPPDDCAAVIGGYVVRDPGLPGLQGRYLYGDLCSGEIRSFDPADPQGSDRWEGLTVPDLNSFGEDSCGRLYAVSGAGQVSRLIEGAATPCGISPRPQPPTVFPPAVDPRLGTYLGIKAANRRVLKRSRALLTVWASPCEGRRGDPVTLWRGAKRVGTRYFDRACSARFRPRITRRWRFRAVVKADASHFAAETRRITITPRRPKR